MVTNEGRFANLFGAVTIIKSDIWETIEQSHSIYYISKFDLQHRPKIQTHDPSIVSIIPKMLLVMYTYVPV